MNQKQNGQAWNMPEDVYEAYKRDFQMGILTVGNVCSANCFFCSQKWNPPGVIRDLKRFLTLEEIEHFTGLTSEKIGMIASAHHTNSGEFFLHPKAMDILRFLVSEDMLSDNPEIFTNGMDLTLEHIKMIKELNLNLYFSLNTVDVATRKKVMGGASRKHQNAIDAINLLDEYDVNYYIWIVPTRSSLSNEDVENTIKRITRSKAKSVQIHRTGFTQFTPSFIAEELKISDQELLEFTMQMKEKHDIEINVMLLLPEEKSKNIFERLRFLFQNAKQLHFKRKLFLCPKSVELELPRVLRQMDIQDYDVQMVPSKVFGGNIDCSGLLLVEDYMSAVDTFLKENQEQKPEVIILPRGSFDVELEDLSMVSINEIKKKFDIPLVPA